MAKRKSRAKRGNSKQPWGPTSKSSGGSPQSGREAPPVGVSSPAVTISGRREIVSDFDRSIVGDLKNIGKVTGVIFAILGILYFALPHILN